MATFRRGGEPKQGIAWFFPAFSVQNVRCQWPDPYAFSGRNKGQGNRKNGNRYLSWAYVEAAKIAKRYYPVINRYYQKKMATTNMAVAIKAISNKLARATRYVLRDRALYDETRLFGGKAEPVSGVGS